MTDVQASSTLNNLYALLLSPTNDQISLLDLADNRVKLSVKTGRNPQFLAVSPNKSHILVVNQLDGTISTFFREDNYRIRDLGTIGASGTPTDITFNSTGTEAYVADQTLGRITVLEILNRDRPKVKKIISVRSDNEFTAIASPFKVAVSQDNNNLYAIDKNNGRVYTFNRQNNDFVQNLTINLSGQTRSTPEEILFDKDKLYITDSTNSTLITVDTKTNAVINTLSLTNQDFRENLIPTRMAINSNAGKLYVVNNGTSSIAVVNINNNTLTKHISLATNTVSNAGGPSDISVSDNGNTIYVTNTVGRNLSIISGTQDILLRNIGTSASAGALVPLSAIKII
ncbi:YncE family protein [bacterium]|nr:MAG: YncE family protein [bacterium]